jgi:RHS repeat-associated protein
VLYWYDEAGHLLGEYDGSGSLIEETIWLSDIPVATLRSGTPVGMFYVHTDHLNTPRQVTRPADNAQMWRWFSDPFGTNAPNENPAGAGPFAYNLRFPGQIFDGAAGLHYNYHRNYWPHLGRYVQPDPIGLEGGLNPYLYAGGNPLRFADPTGLQAWEPGLEPPSKIPGGPWTPAGPGQLPGDFYGPAQPSGPRDMCRYVPDAENGGPIDVPEAYWKTKIGGQRGWRQRYNLGGDPISAAEAHRGNPPLEPLPPSVPPAVPWAFFLWALFHSEPAY